MPEPTTKPEDLKGDAKEDPKADPKADAKPDLEPDTKESLEVTEPTGYIRSVFGRMVDPHSGVEYSTVPKPHFQHTKWVQSQIDAGKMVISDGEDLKPAE